MKCVGAEDASPCQRCKRAGVDCIFEKHRRGRKPGSKLSEASKMLRRLEKGLNSAKLKSQSHEPIPTSFTQDTRPGFGNIELPPLNLPPDYNGPYPRSAVTNNPHSPGNDADEDDDDSDKTGEAIFPVQLIRKERNSFFKTILNPENHEPQPAHNPSGSQPSPPPHQSPSSPPASVVSASSHNTSGPRDPIAAGLIDEKQATVFFDLFFLRLNPFINLFDPSLHTVSYIRSRCPFLFTTIIMACCKFFQPDLYITVQKVAHEFAVKAFAEAWKRVEVVQAFACLTYWKEPDDTRTWTYIGYACRMAVELGLNRYVGRRPTEETEFQMRERRNRERTYLVLFVHDRSLSTQTGRNWMLPEDELVRHSPTWHEEGGAPIRPEDVIVCAFIQLRLIATETTDYFSPHRRSVGTQPADTDREQMLKTCNTKLDQWLEHWLGEMKKAGGEKFHFAFLNFFRLYVRLFLNSFGIQSPRYPYANSTTAIIACYKSGLEHLRIVTRDFATISMLRYGQDTITVMTAYCAVFLLKLLRTSNALADSQDGAKDEIYSVIQKTAEAYSAASDPSQYSTSAAHHARFLRNLIASDIFRTKQAEQERFQQANRSNDAVTTQASYATSHPNHLHLMQQQQYPQGMVFEHQAYRFPVSPPSSQPPVALPQMQNGNGMREPDPSPTGDSNIAMPNNGTSSVEGYNYAPPMTHSHLPAHPQQQASPPSASDVHYWKTMFRELGFAENDPSHPYVNVNYMPNPAIMEGGVQVPPNGMAAYQEGHVNGHGYVSQEYHQQAQAQAQQQYSMGMYPPPHGYGSLGR